MAKWIEPQPIEAPDALLRALPSLDGWETLVAKLLVRRGITDPIAARAFLDPNAYRPASPYELPGMERTVERLTTAIQRGEQIAVWGDFDVDGQTATALYYQALQTLGAQVRFTIPTRLQSHGVHPAGVQRLIEEGMELIVTADTGASAHTAIDLANRQEADVLVTDHHDLPPNLPEAYALVDPKLLEDGHPLHGLPGVGVAYQVVRALERELGKAGAADAALDLVALGIVADVAMIEGDTRYLLQRGLDALRRTERPGLLALMGVADLEPAYLDEEDIGFALAPRLNALSRVAQYPGAAFDAASALDATSGVDLLTTDDEVRARTLAVAMEALNARRRWLTRQTFDAALAQLERDRSLLERPALVLHGANWDPGIVGIVAGRLVDRYNRPAIVLSAPPGEIARGSARSIEGVDIHAAIAEAAVEAPLYRYGGHPMAAGLSLDETAIGAFRRALWRAVARVTPKPVEPELAIGADLSLDQLSLDLVKAVRCLAPFGLGNEAPVFVARGLNVASSRIIGRTRAHRRLVVRDGAGRQQEVLWWYSADQEPPQGTFDLAFRVGINRFRGEERAQLTWVDARALEAPAVEVEIKPPIIVRDQRRLAAARPISGRAVMLRALLDEARGPTMVWGEALSAADKPAGVRLHDRRALRPARTLVVWTAPPSVELWEAALDVVAPQEVVLVCLDPGMDAPRAFVSRLAGLIKYALRQFQGRSRLASLAAAMAQTEWAVRLGLRLLAATAQIAFEVEGPWVTLRVPGTAAPVREAERIEELLLAELQETAAYRAYVQRADADRLVNVGSEVTE